MKKISNLFKMLKKSIEKFPLTIIGIFILTVISAINLDNDFISITVFENILVFITIFASTTFLIETLLENKIKSRILYYVISAFWAGILTFPMNIKQGFLGMSNEVFLFRMGRFIICYLIAIIALSIYYNYKRSNKKFEEYLTSTFVNIFKTSLIYAILAIGIAIITLIFIYLILDGEDYDLVARVEILLLGIYYAPTVLYSFCDKKEEIGKFSKIVIKYVLDTLVMIAFVIIYMYIIKIIILRDIPSNQIFRILSALFIIGLPIWTMNLSLDEGKIFDKINKKLPLLFIPFIILQIYAVGVRINANGFTEPRYLCLMLIIFEIIYTIVYVKNKQKVGNMILVFILLTVISTIVPYINMFTISNLSQYNNLKIYKQKTEYTEDEKSKIYGAYYYLQHSVEGEKYIDSYLTEEEISQIIEFQYDTNMKKNTTRNIYLNKYMDYIDVEGYKKLYEVTAYNYMRNKNEERVYEVFSSLTFVTEEQNYNIIINIMPLVNEYINMDEQDIDTYFQENNEFEIDSNRKIILTKFFVEYDEYTNVVSYYNIDGYLLEK